MCKDLGGTFLLSIAETFLLLCMELFVVLVEDLVNKTEVDIDGGFVTFGVENCGALVVSDDLVAGDALDIGDTLDTGAALLTDDAGFFLILDMFLSLLTGVI